MTPPLSEKGGKGELATYAKSALSFHPHIYIMSFLKIS